MLQAVFLKVDDPFRSSKGSRELGNMRKCRWKMQPQTPHPLVILNWIQKPKSNCRVWNLNTASAHQANLGFSIASQLQHSAGEDKPLPFHLYLYHSRRQRNGLNWQRGEEGSFTLQHATVLITEAVSTSIRCQADEGLVPYKQSGLPANRGNSSSDLISSCLSTFLSNLTHTLDFTCWKKWLISTVFKKP